MRTTNFDSIAASVPVDGTAVNVVSRGEHYEGRVPAWHLHWKAPPLAIDEKPHNAENLEGVRFGLMQVVRFYSRSYGHPKGCRWVVRCNCGDYEVRRTAAIKKADTEHRCQACDWVRHVQYVLQNRGGA